MCCVEDVVVHGVIAGLLLLLVVALLLVRNRPSPRHEFILAGVAWLAERSSAPNDSSSAPHDTPAEFTSFSHSRII